MRILLTGGAGDLGTVLAPLLEQRGDLPLRLDLVPPREPYGVYVAGSILERSCLARVLHGVDAVVHIAAWHGVHETRRHKDAYAFWELNVTGTFQVFEAAARAGIHQVIYLSSTSIRHRDSLYGHTKVLGEELAQTYARRHGMRVVILRPRGFIPHWNRAVYGSFVEWAQWFWGGAVHIDDVAQAVLNSLDLLATTPLEQALTLVVDGAYDYTDDDLQHWDCQGPGSTFRQYYPQYYDLAVRYGLDPTRKPFKLDTTSTRQWLGHAPHYSLKNLLDELARYGPAGPPAPFPVPHDLPPRMS
jgi:nucleoside-diphosphate-sugar epimerase